MAFLLSCQGLAKAFGDQQLFTGIDLIVQPGDRIGLIGPNGSGKSTLSKLICGLEEADAGTIQRRKNLVIGYLAQEDRFAEELSPTANLVEALAEAPLDEAEKLSRARMLLSKAEFPEDEAPVARLSGGWRKRLAVCRALVAEPDLLVMDEPTNHLDLEGIIWLERILAGSFSGSASAYVVISHDRRFLENCANRMIELSRVYPAGSLQTEGAYSSFLEKRQEFLEQQSRFEDRLANRVRRETEWLRRGPKARTSKARYRVEEAHRLQGELGQVRRRNRSGSTVGLDFSATGRKTRKLLEARGLAKEFAGKSLFKGIDLTLSPGTRLGLLGRNGCGKSTLMKILAGDDGGQQPDSGTISLADGVRVVSFFQDRTGLDQQATLRRALAPEGDSVIYRGRLVHVVSWAERFLFRPDQLETPVGRLSGGEQARILIAALVRQPADILLLDEPTNDLDLDSLNVLEESLLEFPGALVLVTHDRYLLGRVCESLLGFVGRGEVHYFADYEQWLKQIAARESEPAAREQATPRSGRSARKKVPGRLSYKDQLEYDAIEETILEAEAERDLLEQRLEDPAVAADPERLRQLWLELETARERVDRLYLRWEELESKREQGF